MIQTRGETVEIIHHKKRRKNDMKKKQLLCLVLALLFLIPWMGASLADQTVYEKPASDDVQEKAAIEQAKATLCEHFTDMQAILDASTAEASFGYLDAEIKAPIWLVEFRDPDAYYGSYFVSLSRKGELISYSAPYSMPYGPDDNELTGVTYATPGAYDISEQEAIRQAKSGLTEIGDYENRMDRLTEKAYFLYGERYNNGDEPVWLIYFYQDDVLQQKTLLAYDGTYIDTVPAEKQFERTSNNTEGLGERFTYNFSEMTVQEKAEFSRKWIPIVEAYSKDHPYYPARKDPFYLATRRVFGIPGKDCISQQEAAKIAREAAVALGANAETMKARKIGYSFDVTDPEHPFWVLILYSAQLEDLQEAIKRENSDPYEVRIDGKTGKVLMSYNTIGKTDEDGFYY